MKIDPIRNGTHNWDVSVHYHRCPKCGKIVQSRGDFPRDEDGDLVKDLNCPSCGCRFRDSKRHGVSER